MTQTPKQPPAGWYPDPAGGGGERFWDGGAWSQSTRDPKPAPWVPSEEPSDPGQHPRQQPPIGTEPYQPALDPRPQQYGGIQVPVQGAHPIAGFWRRVLGYAVDWVLISLLAFFLVGDLQARTSNAMSIYFARTIESAIDSTAPMPSLPSTLLVDTAILAVVGILLVVGYRVLTVGLMNATLGQKLVGVRVAKLGDEELGAVGWRTAILRGVFAGLLYETIGFFAQISVLFTERKQTVPDLLAKTVVVNTREALQ